MNLGIFAKTFARPSVDATLAAAARAGLGCVQFNLACAGLPTLPDVPVPAAVTDEVRRAADRHGVGIAAVSGTFNMAHPLGFVRQDGLRRLRHLLAWAGDAGVPVVTLCTGTRDAGDMWREHPGNRSEGAWADLVETLTPALAAAEGVGVTLAVEPEPANVVADARDARRLLDDFRGAPLKVILDPANLVGDTATPAENRARLAAAVDLLVSDAVLVHAKDRRADGSVCPAGQGLVEFPPFLGHLRRRGYAGPLVIHGVDEGEVPSAVGYLRAALPTSDPEESCHALR